MNCKHKVWLIVNSIDGIEWCYVCGAIRKIKASNTGNGYYPIEKHWNYPSHNRNINPVKVRK